MILSMPGGFLNLPVATIEGKNLLNNSDICPSIWRMMDMNLCNYDMLQKYQLEDPQALAIEGKWTLDKQLEMVTGIYEDLNKNNQKDAEDQFGIMSTLAITDAYFYCTGAKMLEKDANGKLTLSKDWAGQKVIDIIERMGNYYSTDDGFITNEFNEYSKIASEGRALFLNCEVYFSESFLADASYNFKVLPVPKYSESQENYPIVLSNPFTVYSIPLDAADPDMSAAVLEAMASESYRKVTPIMYEKLIKLRYVGSETDSAMIDIIRKGITFDTARLFYFNFTDLYAFRRHIQGNLRTWTSTVTGLTESYKKVVEEISTKYASLE